jgi:CoA:oxalate CoA-transferase
VLVWRRPTIAQTSRAEVGADVESDDGRHTLTRGAENADVRSACGRTAGPYCGKLLAGLGADVIKVEPRGEGDRSRRIGPFVGDDRHPEKSIPFLYLNTGKRGITLDLDAPHATETIRELARVADIVIEDFLPDQRASLGVAYEQLADINQRLVVTSVTPFGLTGAFANYLGPEIVVQALCGHMAITGDPEREPLQVGGNLAQFVAGQTAFVGTMFAVYNALVTGEGQEVDSSVAEAFADILDGEALLALTRPRTRLGNFSEGSFLRGRGGLYECSDGWIALGQTPGGWDAFFEIFDDDRLRDPSLREPATRLARKTEIESIVEDWLRTHTKLETYLASQENRNVAGFVATPEDLLASPHLREREYFVRLDHPVAGAADYAGAPFQITGESWVNMRAPLLGEHNHEVYADLLGMAASAF